MSKSEAKGKGGDARRLQDYLEQNHLEYGYEQLNRTEPIKYFLPLMRELFNVHEARTHVAFSILHGLMLDDRVQWTRHELDEKFHWVKSSQRGYILQRLSQVGWLEYYREKSVYMLTDKGEALMRILSRFTLGESIVENEGAALAEIEFSMMLDLNDLPERMTYLRNRLVKHNIRANSALESDSAYKVLEVYQQLQSAYRWAEQTRHTLDQVELEDDEPELWDSIRQVHLHLSSLHSQISQMQLVLQDIQRKQINIAKYGLTHLDFDNYLINSSVDRLADMMQSNLKEIPHPFFMMEDLLFNETADLFDAEPAEQVELRGWDTEFVPNEYEEKSQLGHETHAFAEDLQQSSKEWQGIKDVICDKEWEVSAYRLSLMTMLADMDDINRTTAGAMDPMLNVKIEADFDQKGKMEKFHIDGEERSISKGKFRRLENEENE
ncbi:MAG: hypothetical protein MK193_05005 [Lentisphaeria bacterium]|nr:hypothetical protein [Lentisphaeria bacterium]